MVLVESYFNLAIVSVWILILAYAVIRIGSFAYFRTKYEYLRRVLHRLNGAHRGE